MPVFKCIICGGDLEIISNETIQRQIYMEDSCYCILDDDIHTDYEACLQRANWCTRRFSDNGFIVQEVIHERVIDGKREYYVHYFEAWTVTDGVCVETNDVESDDVFGVGFPYEELESIRRSMGHYGIVLYNPQIYWVDKTDIPYDYIANWSESIEEANGLKSEKYNDYTARLFDDLNAFDRKDFIHQWDFRNPETIEAGIKAYCVKMFFPKTKTSNIQFYNAISNMHFDERYSDVREEIMNWWKQQ